MNTPLPKFAQHSRTLLGLVATLGPMVRAYVDGQLDLTTVVKDPAAFDALLANLGLSVTSATLFGVTFTEWFRRGLVRLGYILEHVNESTLPDAVHPAMNKIADAIYALRAAGQPVESLREAFNEQFDATVDAVDEELGLPPTFPTTTV